MRVQMIIVRAKLYEKTEDHALNVHSRRAAYAGHDSKVKLHVTFCPLRSRIETPIELMAAYSSVEITLHGGIKLFTS